ncbi:M50 family metallopeptidase [Natronoglycomyces albus]|uniref:Zinc metalloprotease n=1 Tax=Natronoglycomyces albus TaxID=2811108 RepID=A0A895XTT9_9ACTN|nr:M50 family metallopeptidase [Natronoglycomyces albus]QSB06735.1 M50 family metallopeptidase [Natronoglycomyces albus]
MASVTSMRRSGFTILRLGGIPIILGYTWLLLAGLIVVIYAPVVDRLVPDLPTAALFAVSSLFALTLLLSVLLHELGHAVTARLCGIGVTSITLDGLGGFTETTREAPRPGISAGIALAGPAVSAALGLVGIAGMLALPSQTIVWTVAFQIAIANLLVTVYNLLPGLPLDGGRAFHALLWKVSGNKDGSYVIAGQAGRAIALATIGLGLYLFSSGWLSLLGLVILAIVGVELWFGASNAVTLGRMRSKLTRVRAADLYLPVVEVPLGTRLNHLPSEFGPQRPAIVIDNGRPVGVAHSHIVGSVPPERTGELGIEDLMRSLQHFPSLEVDLTGGDLIDAMRARPADEYLVCDGEELKGILLASAVVRRLR